jgi:ABC-type multidrug transport system ATPase subunit
MLAIMGPSGSGKTTLLNALAHRVAAAGATTTGDILVNGSKASLQLIRGVSRYVEQEDALIGSLTVRETMIFAARLSLPSYVNGPLCGVGCRKRELLSHLLTRPPPQKRH